MLQDYKQSISELGVRTSLPKLHTTSFADWNVQSQISRLFGTESLL